MVVEVVEVVKGVRGAMSYLLFIYAIMKNIQYYLFVIGCLAFVTCAKEESVPLNNIMAGKSLLDFEAEGGTITLDIKTRVSGASWIIKKNVDWCSILDERYGLNKIYGHGDQEITVRLKPNEDGKERETDLIIQSDYSEDIIYVKIKQKFKYATELSVSSDFVDMATNVTHASVQLTADAFWEVIDVPEWISVYPMKGFGDLYIGVSSKEDKTGTGIFKISAAGKSVDITVRKWGKEDACIETGGADRLDNILYNNKLYNVTKKLKISGWMSTLDFNAIKKMLVLEELDLTGIQFRNGVNALSAYVLSECKFQSVTLPENLLSIETGAFSACIMLQAIDIPEGVVSLGSYAFSWCTALERATLPETLKSIDSYAFSSCPGLKEIHMKNKHPFAVQSIADFSMFATCTLYVPKGSKEKYQKTTGWSNFSIIVEE
jgi:hypothetical protein